MAGFDVKGSDICNPIVRAAYTLGGEYQNKKPLARRGLRESVGA